MINATASVPEVEEYKCRHQQQSVSFEVCVVLCCVSFSLIQQFRMRFQLPISLEGRASCLSRLVFANLKFYHWEADPPIRRVERFGSGRGERLESRLSRSTGSYSGGPLPTVRCLQGGWKVADNTKGRSTRRRNFGKIRNFSFQLLAQRRKQKLRKKRLREEEDELILLMLITNTPVERSPSLFRRRCK
jgi:hypothetical protein